MILKDVNNLSNDDCMNYMKAMEDGGGKSYPYRYSIWRYK